MHRFRKKSETRPSPISISTHSQTSDDQDSLPELPPANDFRTSLILPDLSRRFSLLRSSTGEPVTFDDLRSRFAEQRARGAENQISEEEEDMIFASLGLGRLRSRNTTNPQTSQENVVEADDPGRQSFRSSNTVTSSLAPSVNSSPSGRSAKRYSNNLFGSGRFRDYTYLRSVAQSKQGRSSLTPTESSVSVRGHPSSVTDHGHSETPEGDISSSSLQSNGNEKLLVQSAPLIPPAPYGEQVPSPPKPTNTTAAKRASLAFEEAIKEMEEEIEDEIVMPRSPIVGRAGPEQSHHAPEGTTMQRDSELSHSSGSVEAGMAISSDKPVSSETDERRASPLPSRILPGYIPGMPRPMTPRDFDLDEQRSHSTTPRATSPMHSTFPDSTTSSVPANIASGLLRRDSSASTARQSPRPASPHSSSPLFLQRSPNGRFSPEEMQRVDPFVDSDNPLGILARRRPASPLASPPYQPLTVSSRPSTPSNITWTTGANHQKSASGHSRNDSWTSDGGFNSDTQGAKSSGRSLRSPALPDSPMLDRSQSPSSSTPMNGSSLPNRPGSAISGIDLGSPVLTATRSARSPTPTQGLPRSPTSPTFDRTSRNGSRRSSKQNAPSPFPTNPFNPIIFSTIANSSRSSLDSAGSSFHSTDGEAKDRTLVLFNDSEQPQTLWHDFSSSDKSSSVTPGGSAADDEWDPEDIVHRHAGLRKSDFLAIQEKLVSVARAKSSASEGRDRVPSLRRRRPSTSQSNYSVNGRDRIASPPPQSQAPSSANASTPTPEQYSKASALLNSVVDSIESPTREAKPQLLDSDGARSASALDRDISPTTRRNRDLAQVLFGPHENDTPEPPAADPAVAQPSPASPSPLPPTPNSGYQEIAYSSTREKEPRSAISLSSPSPYLLTRNPSTQRIPQTPQEEEKLTREVQQKVDAATLALKKRPSNSNLADGSNTASISRKRINPHQISTPQLISASTSVDTIPLRPPSLTSHNASPSKIGSRLKRLRGTLRAKPTPANNDEVITSPPDSSNSPPSQMAYYDPAKLRAPGSNVTTSATENRFKLPIPSPPASAGPGLKGFMARFRPKTRVPDPLPPPPPREPSPPPPRKQPSPIPAPPSPQNGHPVVQAEQLQTPTPSESYSSITPRAQPPQLPPVHTSQPSTDTTESLKALYVAASNLGLDESELNALVARSHSTSSRSTDWTLLAKKSSATSSKQATREDNAGDGVLPSVRSDESPAVDQPVPAEDTSHRPPVTDGSASVEHGTAAEDSPTRGQQATTTRKRSVRKTIDGTRRPREALSDNAQNMIVRRTIILPSEMPPNFDLAALVRKTSAKHKRVSAASLSVRSIHERAPTPPPPKSPTNARFSSEGSPPVPLLPGSLGPPPPDTHLGVPGPSVAGSIEKSSSTYDSLYEFYAGDSRVTSSATSEGNAPEGSQPGQGEGGVPSTETVPALELLEMANGDTIWQIVNGLRDEEDEPLDTARNSFASEYSTRENGGDGLQIFVKEHGRAGSKGSNASFVSRKRNPQGKARPETKVFYSSSAQIGRLIENLSQGMDAGSFNFMPNRVPGHSASSSLSTNDIQWTMEERVDHMLNTINNPHKPA